MSSLQKQNETWWMRVKFCKSNQAVATTAAVLPDVVYLLAQINIASGTWNEAIDLGNVFLSIPIKEDQKTFTFTWD